MAKKPQTAELFRAPFPWRTAAQIRGNMAQLLYALEHPTANSDVCLEKKTAKNLYEICKQALHTEVGHEGP